MKVTENLKCTQGALAALQGLSRPVWLQRPCWTLQMWDVPSTVESSGWVATLSLRVKWGARQGLSREAWGLLRWRQIPGEWHWGAGSGGCGGDADRWHVGWGGRRRHQARRVEATRSAVLGLQGSYL